MKRLFIPPLELAPGIYNYGPMGSTKATGLKQRLKKEVVLSGLRLERSL